MRGVTFAGKLFIGLVLTADFAIVPLRTAPLLFWYETAPHFSCAARIVFFAGIIK